MILHNHTDYESADLKALIKAVALDEGLRSEQLDTLVVEAYYEGAHGARSDRKRDGRMVRAQGRFREAALAGLRFNRFCFTVPRDPAMAQAIQYRPAFALLVHELAECLGRDHAWMKSRANPGRYGYGRRRGKYWHAVVDALPMRVALSSCDNI